MIPTMPGARQARPALASLYRLGKQPAGQERCELCGAGILEAHSHLVEPARRRLICACEPCAILFSAQGASRYRRVPREVGIWADFRLTDLQWEGLGLPVNLAFFLSSSAAGRVVAVYPSPGGATEYGLPQEAWQGLVEMNPGLGELEEDLEALLINRVGLARDHYRVGIDECYRLVGIVRSYWQGFSGGSVWDEIGRYFAHLRSRAIIIGAPPHG